MKPITNPLRKKLGTSPTHAAISKKFLPPYPQPLSKLASPRLLHTTRKQPAIPPSQKESPKKPLPQVEEGDHFETSQFDEGPALVSLSAKKPQQPLALQVRHQKNAQSTDFHHPPIKNLVSSIIQGASGIGFLQPIQEGSAPHMPSRLSFEQQSQERKSSSKNNPSTFIASSSLTTSRNVKNLLRNLETSTGAIIGSMKHQVKNTEQNTLKASRSLESIIPFSHDNKKHSYGFKAKVSERQKFSNSRRQTLLPLSTALRNYQTAHQAMNPESHRLPSFDSSLHIRSTLEGRISPPSLILPTTHDTKIPRKQQTSISNSLSPMHRGEDDEPYNNTLPNTRGDLIQQLGDKQRECVTLKSENQALSQRLIRAEQDIRKLQEQMSAMVGKKMPSSNAGIRAFKKDFDSKEHTQQRQKSIEIGSTTKKLAPPTAQTPYYYQNVTLTKSMQKQEIGQGFDHYIPATSSMSSRRQYYTNITPKSGGGAVEVELAKVKRRVKQVLIQSKARETALIERVKELENKLSRRQLNDSLDDVDDSLGLEER
ncbi:hypothetical protein FGO68_gene1253 [Halteria grandinella]|uniref:Uncharacterized protein n=1 Tax=Halteria grandinella TaxID=5974 RepID=A0A8J8NTF6_HALGN|nr:hypothetical protein FGO68_gene1253 [Halteria grandinella]